MMVSRFSVGIYEVNDYCRISSIKLKFLFGLCYLEPFGGELLVQKLTFEDKLEPPGIM